MKFRFSLSELSVRKIVYALLIFLFIPSTILLLVIFFHSLSMEIRNETKSVENEQAEIIASLSDSLNKVKKDAINAASSYSFLFFCNKSTPTKLYNFAKDYSSTYFPTYLSVPETAAVFLYNRSCDFIWSSYKYTGSQQKTDGIIDYCRSLSKSEMRYSRLDLITLSDKTYIVHTEALRYGTLIVLMDPERNLRLATYNSLHIKDGIFSFVKQDKVPDPETSRYHLLGIMNDRLFLRYIPENRSSLTTQQWIIIILVMLLIIFELIMIIVVARFVLAPLDAITRAMTQISEGNIHDRIPDINAVEDITRLRTGINSMLDSIQEKEQEGFDFRMDATQAKLQYLQLQIRPHFYLNCMKNLYSLIQLDKKEEAATLLLGLSDYISHSFMDIKNFITVKEELESVQSYVNLNRMLSRDVSLSLKVTAKCLLRPCLPMVILTFVENSIKHAKSNEPLRIEVSAIMDPLEENIIIRIMDDGGGYSESAIQDFYRQDPSRITYRRTHIGMINVRYRLWLVYRDETAVNVWNDGNHAVTELRIPASWVPDDLDPVFTEDMDEIGDIL